MSGVGSIAVQLAKNCLGAAKVITTVSTAKVPKVEGLLGKDVVDQGLSPFYFTLPFLNHSYKPSN